MKILKHGNRKPRKFICCNCGCEFVADVQEYWTTNYTGTEFCSTCPECDDNTTISVPWEEE